jgi:hypothetical protein
MIVNFVSADAAGSKFGGEGSSSPLRQESQLTPSWRDMAGEGATTAAGLKTVSTEATRASVEKTGVAVPWAKWLLSSSSSAKDPS